MISIVSRDWWVFALRGIAAILFGVLAFGSRGITFALVLLLAAYAFVDGVSLLIALARGDADAHRHAWSRGIMGVLGILGLAHRLPSIHSVDAALRKRTAAS
jgi:uncharacterized membrane protein HdeD (DUF308 family)